MSMTTAQIETYFLQRLDPYRIRHSKGTEYRSRCPMHGGNNGSALAIDLEDGKYFCFSCGAKGRGAITFEQGVQQAETGINPPFEIARTAVEQIIGTPFEKRIHVDPVVGKKGGWNRKQARDRYIYTDEVGNELFSVWRFIDRNGNKATPPDHPCGCSPDAECDLCEDGRVWGSKGVRRVLYRWPDVIQSSIVFVVEGEKNANDLSRALGVHLKKAGGMTLGALTVDRIGVTTNPGGAMAWKPEYGFGRQFQSKVVIKLGDNDPQGRLHDEAVCRDVAPFASKVFTMELPVGDGEDISDYLAQHTIADLFKLFSTNLKPWQQPEAEVSKVEQDLAPRQILVRPSSLVRGDREGGDWLVDRLVPKGARGLVIAPPKTGKSFFFLDLALALGTCGNVLGIRAHGNPVRVAIISREDGPFLVSERLKALANGRGIPWSIVDSHIRVNTVEQSQNFRIDHDGDLEEMAEWLKAERIEFCVVDVLNKLHSGDENKANDMTTVMARFDRLAALSGSDVCVIHHTNKSGGARGSSAIEGWADYIFRLEADTADESLKTLFVKTKASGNVIPRMMKYEQSADMKTSRIMVVVPR